MKKFSWRIFIKFSTFYSICEDADTLIDWRITSEHLIMKRSTRQHHKVPSNLGSDADSSESKDGSEDLFSSHASTDPVLNDDIDLTLQLTESVWVQCDKPECQKWRRVPVSESSHLDAVWYCDMNPDVKRNVCSAPEEDYAMYDKMAKKAGIKYVMSSFDVGSLVWAKMAGYCSWPALVTQDPGMGTHVIEDIDGDPHSYHVEFLGKPHTHSWVAAKSVDVYGYKRRDEPCHTSKTKKKGKKGRPKTQNMSTQGGQKEKKSYKRTNIEDVVVEADFLLYMTCSERLEYSIFRYMPEEENRNILINCEKNPQKNKRGRKRQCPLTTLNPNSDNHQQVDRKQCEATTMSTTEKLNKGQKGSTQGPQCMFDSPAQFSQSKLKYLNTLADKSKEEKFRMDVDMYRRNEAAFEHDVRRFMSRHGQQIKNTPVWHNVPVTLFQLYLSVNERGGFLQVTARKQWTEVYRELTEQHKVLSGVQAKKYYQQNLYPFELFITGKEYQHSFVCKQKKVKVSKQSMEVPSNTCKPKHTVNSQVRDSGCPTSTQSKPQTTPFDDHSSVTEDIERILDSLKEEDDVSSFHDWNRRKHAVKFHDDDTATPTQHNSIPSEFQLSPTNNKVHEVTNLTDYESGLSDLEQNILHEMKALEDDVF